MDENEAAGWESITAAFAHAYPGVDPVHRAPAVPPGLGGSLNGISAYASDDRWHFVTYGLTELFGKDSDDPDLSGWGYELTLLTPPSSDPPPWAFNLLLGVAGATQNKGEVFERGHRLDPGGPIDGDVSHLRAIAFTADRVVHPTEFPNGSYEFLQLVGLTRAELEEARQRIPGRSWTASLRRMDCSVQIHAAPREQFVLAAARQSSSAASSTSSSSTTSPPSFNSAWAS